jgi:hypothetical protein
MKRIASGSQVASIPTFPADTGTPGYFADAATTPSATPTAITSKWVTSLQEAVCQTIEGAGVALSDTMSQFADVVKGVHAVKAHATDTGVVSPPLARAVVAAVGSRATGVGSGCFAGGSGLASGQAAAVLGGETMNATGQNSACVGGGSHTASALDAVCVGGTSGLASAADAGTFAGDNPTASAAKAVAIGGHDLTASAANAAAIGGDTNVAAADESFVGGGNSHDIQSGSTRAAVVGGNNHTITAARAIALGGDSHTLGGADSAALGGANNIVSAAKSFVIGGTGNDIASGAAQCGVLASDTCQIMATSSKTNMLLLASKYAELHTDGDPSGGGADGFCVAGGYSGSDPGATVTNTNLEWLLSSKHGTLALDNTSLISGADYAELFENAVDGVIPPGSLVARAGRKVRLARPGDRVLGVVSANPSVVGNAADLNWSGRKLRDEWGAIVYEDVELVAFEVTGEDGVTYLYDGPLSACPVPVPEGTPVRVSREPARNPDFDASLPYVARRHRPDQWTAVALLGQVRVRIGKGVEEGDYLTPGADGCALGTLARPDGRPVEVMEITTPFDAARGHGVALCLVG